MSELSSAAQAGSQNYLQHAERVSNECAMLHEILSSLPIHVLEGLSPKAVDKFMKIITSYDRESGRFFKLAAWYNEEQHSSVCTNVLRSVLFSCIKMYNTSSISSSFAQRLIIQSLDRARSLTGLFLGTLTETDHSAILASNIHHLTQLTMFRYCHHCTDEVVRQLALHCKKLFYIDLTESSSVTDVSIHYLLELKEMQYVHLLRTSTTLRSYCLLIAELPLIKNIITFTPFTQITPILDNIRTQSMSKITYFFGFVGNTTLLTQKCPNLIHLTVYRHNGDLSSLAALAALASLTSLHIIRGNYELFNLDAVLNGIGHRLCELGLYEVENVNMTDITTLCSGLKRLILECCAFVPLDYGREFNTETQHFKSVLRLKIIQNSLSQFDYPHLRYYVNLEVFECAGLHFLDLEFMREALQHGAFRKLKCLTIKETGNGGLTVSTVDLLIQHCENLKVLGNLKTWQQLTRNMILDLKKRIVLQNIDLRIV
jgi:hypothetical protein